VTLTAAQREQTRALLDSLREAGLGGHVQLGIPLPPESPPFPRHAGAVADGPAPYRLARPDFGPPAPAEEGAEGEIFPPDVFLRPLERTTEGRLIEIAGGRSSGRTALAYRLIAGATSRGELVAWVDPPNALDPRFLRRSGADLDTLLWVRPPGLPSALRAAELLLKTGFAVVALDLEGISPHAIQKLGAAVWSRLLRAVKGSRASVVLLHPERVSGSAATLGLYTEREQALFDRGLFEGLEAQASVVRNRKGPTDLEVSFRVFHRPVPALR